MLRLIIMKWDYGQLKSLLAKRPITNVGERMILQNTVPCKFVIFDFRASISSGWSKW